MTISQQPAMRLAALTGVGVFLMLPGCRASLPDQAIPKPGTYHQTTPLRYGLTTRTYRVHVPRDYSEERAWPLILMLHGAFSTAEDIEKWSGLSDLADREGFVVAYPNGIGLFGFLQHWNAGHCCGRGSADNVDDVGFLNHVIRDISDRLHIDPRRLYVVGHSNGGMLAYYYAAQESGRVAGIGVVAGSIGSSKSAHEPPFRVGPPERAVPLIAVHGRDDESVPFEGGSGLRSGKRRYVSVLDSVESWARYAGCKRAPEVREDPEGGQRIMTWRDGDGNVLAVLRILDGWGHMWPGTSFIRGLPQDHPLRPFQASRVIWDFLRNHTQPSTDNDLAASASAGR